MINQVRLMDFLNAVQTQDVVYVYCIPKFEAEHLADVYPQVFPILDGFLEAAEKSKSNFSLRFENGETRNILLDFNPKYKYMLLGFGKDHPKEYFWDKLFVARGQFDTTFLDNLL